MDDGTAYVLMQIHSQMCAFLYFNKNEIKFFLASFEKWVAYTTSVKTFDHFFILMARVYIYEWCGKITAVQLNPVVRMMD